MQVIIIHSFIFDTCGHVKNGYKHDLIKCKNISDRLLSKISNIIIAHIPSVNRNRLH